MTDRKLELSRRKILAGVGAVGAAGAGAGLGTSALFSDEEEFEDNTITAGTTNLTVEATVAAISDGLDNSPGEVIIEATDNDGDDNPEIDGDAEIGITATDIKPGDEFVVGFNVIVEENPMYVAAQASNVENDGGDTTEPEPTPDNGELGANIDTVLGYDGNANDFIWDPGSATPPPNTEFEGSQSLTAFLDNLANSGFLYQDGTGSGVPEGHGTADPTELGSGENVTHWQYFKIPIGVGNEIQGDSVSWDVTWYGEQVRNNPEPSGPRDVIDGSPNSSGDNTDHGGPELDSGVT